MKHWSCGLKQESIPNTMVIQGTPDGSGAGGGGVAGGPCPPIVETRRKIGNLLCCWNLRGQAYLHLRFPNIRL